MIVDLQLDELKDFMARVDPTGIMFWIPAEPEDQQNVLKQVKAW